MEPAQKAVQQAQQVAKQSANSFNSAKQSISKYKQEISSTTAQQTLLQRKLNDLNNIINNPKSSKYYSSEEILKMRVEAEKLEKQLSRLGSSGKKVDISPHANNTSKAINKAVSSIKRFAMSLFGIESIFAVLSRATSSYMAVDEDLSNKVQGTWVGLGAILSPIIEYIVNLMRYGLAYINAFVKALTGIDYVARANAKSLAKQAKANKEANKQLAGIDGDITNLSDSSGSDGSSGASAPDLNLPDIDTTKVTEFANKVKEIWDWLTKNKELVIGISIALGLAFSITKIVDFIDGISKLDTALSTIHKNSFWKTLGGIVLIIGGIIAAVFAVVELLKEDSNLGKAFGFILLSIGLIMAGVLLIFGVIPALITGLVVAIGFLILTLITKWDAFVAGLKYILKLVLDWLVDKWTKLGDFIVDVLTSIGDFFIGVFNGIKDFFLGIVNWIIDKVKGIGETFSNVWDNVKNGFLNIWDIIKNTVSKIGTTIADAVGGTIKGVVNGIIGFAENTINGFIKAINLAIGLINAIPGVNITKLNLLNIPRMATGGVATGSTLANIGEGKYQEAVIPLGQSPQFADMKRDIADAVSDKSGGGIDNLTIQVGTRKLYDDVIDYINAKSRRLGKPVIKVGV